MSHYDRLAEIYQSGTVPWDREEPPPEVLQTVPKLPPGRALDLGCGYGRASLFMARLGWQVDGVDFIEQAVIEATGRANNLGLGQQITFHLGSVTELDFLTGPYDFALDVGCVHSLPLEELQKYHQGLLRLLNPAGLYLLFAHLNEVDKEQTGRRWLDEATLLNIFQNGFALEKTEYGQTQVGNQEPWWSAWFWFRRV